MTETVYVRFKLRGRTAAEWVTSNEVLLAREMGLETDTRRFKFGDGVTAWNSLAYPPADLTGALLTSQLDTDGTLAANSDAKVASQKAVKTYVDTAVTGLLDFKGNTNCSANPNYPAALKGDAYVVSVAGKIGGASGVSVDVGDVFVASADNAGGTQAAVGASWFLLEHNLAGALLTSDLGVTVQAYSANLAAFSGKTAPSGAVVGTTDTQTLTNKTLGATNLPSSGAIASDGKIGIGTAPTHWLDIVQSVAGPVNVRVRNNDAGASAYAMVGVNASGNSWGMRMGSSAANGNALEWAVDAFGTPTVRMALSTAGVLKLPSIGTYANNAAAVAGGLTVGQIYKTATGEVRIVV